MEQKTYNRIHKTWPLDFIPRWLPPPLLPSSHPSSLLTHHYHPFTPKLHLRSKCTGVLIKSLARPRRKQATATKLLTFACHSKKKKNSEGCPSNQASTAGMTSASEEMWRPFNWFLQSGRAKDLSAPLYVSVASLCILHTLPIRSSV